MLSKLCSGLAAGLMISLGGCVYLACDNKYVGALLFSVALLTICIKGYSLYTGKIGYIGANHSREAVSVLLLGLLGNFLATLAVGLAVRAALPNLGDAALVCCTAKLGQSLGSALLRGVLCGVLVYVAVSVYKDGKNVLGIVFGIPAFILSGFEHCIADMFYFSASGIVSLRALAFIWTIVLGNSLGALILPCLESAGRKERAHV